MAQRSLNNQIIALTDITISSSGTNPTQADVTDYLVDGVREVAERIILIKPEEADLFCATENIAVDGFEISSGHVLSVIRNNGSSINLYGNPADRITEGLAALSKNPESLHYRSPHNPGWYLKSGKLYIVPEPTGDGINNAYVTYVKYDSDVTFATNSGEIANFPDKYQHLVVLFAGCRALLNAMGYTLTLISDYQAPVITTAADGSGMTQETDKDLTQMSTVAWTGIDFDFDDENIDVLKWFQVVGDMIQRQEDLELASAQIDKINAYLSAYNAALTNSSNKFDKKLAKYTADYQWMADRHQRLYSEYIAYFSSLAGVQNARQQAQEEE
tara:strand:- start:234 stop:1223 length:990 start_codon:yes stop_codon:yes gene_type:complete